MSHELLVSTSVKISSPRNSQHPLKRGTGLHLKFTLISKCGAPPVHSEWQKNPQHFRDALQANFYSTMFTKKRDSSVSIVTRQGLHFWRAPGLSVHQIQTAAATHSTACKCLTLTTNLHLLLNIKKNRSHTSTKHSGQQSWTEHVTREAMYV